MNIIDIDIDQLQPHPDNVKIYGAEDVTELAEDIRQSGWVKELVVTDFYGTGNYTIVSGHRRHKAAQKLGMDVLPCFVQDFTAEWEVLDRLLRENKTREKTEVQRIMEFKKWKEVEAAKAKERYGGRHKESTVENFPQLHEGKARDFAAEQVGLGSGRNAEKGEKVVDLAMELREQGQDKKADLLLDIINKDSYNGAATIAKEIDRIDDEAAEEIRRQVAEKKMKAVAALREVKRKAVYNSLEKHELKAGPKKYRVIYADPPWSYGNAMPEYVTEPKDYYMLMSTPEICAMPVSDIAEDNAVLFLWTTSPHLEECFDVIRAWGFKYKTSFVWDKVKHNMGHYNSVRHEFLLVCTRGSCTPDVKKLFDSVVSIERGAHSEKPEYFREVIDTIYPYGERVELFARNAPAGWDVFGNQIDVQ